MVVVRGVSIFEKNDSGQTIAEKGEEDLKPLT
jgi:hypothetical protein